MQVTMIMLVLPKWYLIRTRISIRSVKSQQYQLRNLLLIHNIQTGDEFLLATKHKVSM